MWDLDSIIRQNNQVALDAMMAGQAVAEAQSPQPKTWPLSWLAEKLKIGPPLLSEIINGLTDADRLGDFLVLIRLFLPQEEAEILSQPRQQRVYKFCYLFGQKYFPLPTGAHDCTVSDFVSSLPVELMAMSYSAYHDLDLRKGYLLLLSLVVYPYEGCEWDEEDDRVPFDPVDLPTGTYKPSGSDIHWLKDLVESLAVDGEWIAPMGFSVVKVADNRIELREAKDTPEVKETIGRTLLAAKRAGIVAEFTRNGRTSQEKLSGARVPLLDLVQTMVGADLAQRIPAAGWSNEDLHRLTDGTPYDGVGHFADWACSETGCVVLDSSYADCQYMYMEGMGEPMFKWTEDNVKLLAEQWPRVKQYREKIDNIVEWVEGDPIDHFRELLDFLLAKPGPKVKGKKKDKPARPYDPADHFCPLEPVTEEEEEDDNA